MVTSLDSTVCDLGYNLRSIKSKTLDVIYVRYQSDTSSILAKRYQGACMILLSFCIRHLSDWVVWLVYDVICESIYQMIIHFLNTISFEDTKGVIRIRKSKKNRQHNGQMKKDKKTNNDLQNIPIKVKIE